MLTVRFKGRIYNLFDTITARSSLDSICSQFSATTTLRNDIRFGKGDFVEILADNISVAAGFVEISSGGINKDDSHITFKGRDQLGDLVDSSVPQEVSVTEGGIMLPSLCSKIINALGIKATVINQAGTIKRFSDEDIIAIEFGGKASDYLQSFARKRQVFLTNDGKGNLVLFRPPTKLTFTEKLTIDSMLPRDFSYSDANRFHKITVGCEDNLSEEFDFDDDDDNGVDRTAFAIDPDIRSTRQLQIQSEESMSYTELKAKAEEEINIRRARGTSFTCTVPTHRYRIGQLIPVDDAESGVRGNFLIRNVDYSQTDQKGTGITSKLTLCFPESYSGVGARTTKRKSKIGESPVTGRNL